MRAPAASRRPGSPSPRRRPCGRWAGRGAGRRRPLPAGRRAPASRRGSARPRRPLRPPCSSGMPSVSAVAYTRAGRMRLPAPEHAVALRRVQPLRDCGLGRKPARRVRARRGCRHSSRRALSVAFIRRTGSPCRVHSPGSNGSGSASGRLLQQDLDFLLGLLERSLAAASEFDAALELLQRVFERQFAVLEAFDDGLEFRRAPVRNRGSWLSCWSRRPPGRASLAQGVGRGQRR